MAGNKISDTDQAIGIGSKSDEYWQGNPIFPYYRELRPGLDKLGIMSKRNDVMKVKDFYKLKSIGFGNWLSNEDRLNYLKGMDIAFYDLNKVMQLGYNIGIYENLSVTFGARGGGRALAHYEPNTQIINITRYKKEGVMIKKLQNFGKKVTEIPKNYLFLETGGIGSFAHEYFHFLDYWAGKYLDKNNTLWALTGGRSTDVYRIGAPGELREITDDIMEKIIWKKPGAIHSDYYKRVLTVVEKSPKHGEYYIRRNELFARASEVFVSEELRRQGITNYFLTDVKYSKKLYLTENEMVEIAPLFRNFLKTFKEKIK